MYCACYENIELLDIVRDRSFSNFSYRKTPYCTPRLTLHCFHALLLMVQKSGVHQLRLVVCPIIFDGFYTSKRWFFGISEPSTVCWMFTEIKIKFEKPDLPDLSTLHPWLVEAWWPSRPRYCLSVLVQLEAAQGAHGTLSQPGQGGQNW